MKPNGGALFLILFGGVFFAVGVGAGFFTVRTLTRAQAMRSWKEASATVLSCNLRVSHGSKGGPSYCAEATYQYEVNGARHTGNRVSLHSGADNIGSFQRRTYAELKRCMDQRQPAVCWINPAHPDESILIRKPRLEMLLFLQLFVLAFGGAGLAIVLTGLFPLVQPSAQAGPGMGGGGHIRMLGAFSHRIAGVLAFVWNGYVAWFLWTAVRVTVPDPVPWYLWLLAISGVIPAAVAAYLIGRVRKYGISVFEMSPMPGVLGGPVSGSIQIPAKVDAPDGFEIALQCIHQYTTGSGKSSSTHRDVLWKDSAHLASGYSCGDATMLPVRFSVPYGEPATTVAAGRNGYYWKLSAKAATPGIDYKAVFDVPVRHTPQSVPTPVFEMPVSTMFQPDPVETVAAREGLNYRKTPDGGFELVFPPGRPRSAAVFLLAFSGGWTVFCVLLWTVFSHTPLLFALIFTLVDACVLAALFNVLFVTRGVIVDRARNECAVWRRVFGLPHRERRIAFGDVLDVQSERAAQSGNTQYYRVVIPVRGGAPVTVGSGLRQWRHAESIAEMLRSSMRP